MVSATDPDCGINAIVNYTLGDGTTKIKEFAVRSDNGDICIESGLDYETRNVYEFPVIATDRGGLSTTAMVKIQITDVNDNPPIFYPSKYNVSLSESGSSSSKTVPVVIVAATDLDSGKFGAITYAIVSGNDGGVFRIEKSTGEVFIDRPDSLSARNRPYHRLNVSAEDGGGLKSLKDAEVYISVIDSKQRPPIFEHTRYTYSVSENVRRNMVVGSVKATVFNPAGRSPLVKYSIYSGDPDGFFTIDSSTGVISTASALDHETKASVLLNVQATSGEPPVYGHTQVNIDVEDVNDNAPEFDSNIVRISIPENVEIGTALYSAHATDEDSGTNGSIDYKILNNPYGGLFKIDAKSGDLSITRRLDYETSQRHSLVITAADAGVPSLSANLTVLVEVQDVNDNPPVFERSEYSLSVLESVAVNTQILQLTAIDADSGNNARITYRIVATNASEDPAIFGIFPNNGWLYIRSPLDRETKDRYTLTVAATDNGTPSETTTTRVLLEILDANDNDPVFSKEAYSFSIEENSRRGTVVGRVTATDADIGDNAAIRYGIIPGNGSFVMNQMTGEITTKEPLDREQKQHHDIVVEAKDQGVPIRSSRIVVSIKVLDVNDNAPEIVDPQEDVISVREEQPIGTEVVRIRAIDIDNGPNASITYTIVNHRDYDGQHVFTIDPLSGIIRTRAVLDHEDKTIYRLGIAASDAGQPPKQSVRILRIEVLDLNDNRPTFTSSSLVFKVKENAAVGYVVGSISISEPLVENSLNAAVSDGYVSYTLTSLSTDALNEAFDIDRSTGSLVVSKRLDRETQSEYKLEVRALDTSALNNPQSSAVTVKIEVADVNDNPPKWPEDPITLQVNENSDIGTAVYNFTATDADIGANGDLRYDLVQQFPSGDSFALDTLTGTLILTSKLDYEAVKEYTLVVSATDQSSNVSERLSTSVTTRILVVDSNDNPPKFTTPSSVVYLPDSLVVGMTVTHVVAVDLDDGENGRVTYVISGGNENGIFSLGYDTGSLTLSKPLPGDVKDFALNVTANDHGTPTKMSSLELKLVVQDSVDSVPKFLEVQYVIEVQEDVAVGSVVTKMSAKTGYQAEARNLSFVLPSDETFDIISSTGEVITKKPLDREQKETYIVTIYVSESFTKTTSFDTTTLVVKILDVNDNFPKFHPGSCYRLSVPENSDPAVVHQIVADDGDEGSNGEVYYSITSGNIGNKFSIDAKTGEISSRYLDRESQSRYHLTIVARDGGNPSLQSDCNLTIAVEDQNDNDPKFDMSKYSVAVSEDVAPDSSILKVHASDADQGINARIIYSLANESHWLFRVDNKTGVITTAGLFDRELQSVYNFHIVATDGGKYNARSQSVPITVKILDVNDNRPIFTDYPFKQKVAPYIQPGQIILKVTALDIDEGTNADIVYSITKGDKFRINPNTGILTTTQSLASHKGKVIYLNVQATDKGNPPRSSTGLVEITVGDLPEGTPQLKFQNDTYQVLVKENAEEFTDIIRVTAIRTDGRKQKVSYHIGSGNEDNIFVINSESGIIQVRDSKNLDYELRKMITLVIEAKTDGSPVLRGYCKVSITLTDENDNSPRFTQQQYTTNVWEGNKKGEFVLRVSASEADEGSNSKILYHIVDGNHDNAFKIEPAFSGILKTNIVLDREIRDLYRLTVIATDEGVPQMTGTTRVRVNVIDVNDNQPTFPPHSIITVKEDTTVGTVLTIVTANDVDTYPPLTYSFAKENYKNDLRYFSIDRYSGKVVLMKDLDFELWQECRLVIVASDMEHSAQTTLTIRVIDVNDNPPVFVQSSYVADLPDTSGLVEVLALNASDADYGDNGRIVYSLVDPVPGFSVDAEEGILRANLSLVPRVEEEVLLTVKATDCGMPPLHTLVSVKVRNQGGVAAGAKASNKMDYKIHVPENTTIGTTITHLSKPFDSPTTFFKITDGNEDSAFEVLNPSGTLILIKPLDRELQTTYDLKISSINLMIEVEDSNDNPPVFQSLTYRKTISENLPIGTTLETVKAIDADAPETPNSEVLYHVTSGNDEGCFKLDSKTGVLVVNKTLDYDEGSRDYNLVIRACDKGVPILCGLSTVLITLEDENDNVPKFPVTEYFEFVKENEVVGTTVFTARAFDEDKGTYGTLKYSIVPSFGQLDNSWKLFQIDQNTGLVTTSTIFDYEQRNRYHFSIQASDLGGSTTTVKVRVDIEGKDEYHPQFTERTYKLTLATSSGLPVGYIVGKVTATDRDKGADGRVLYQLTTQHPFFKVNRTTGEILIKKKLEYVDLPSNGREISLVITAGSGKQGSLTNMTVVEIILDPLADPGTNLAINREKDVAVPAATSGIADWALGLLIALILLILMLVGVFLFLHLKNKRNKKLNKPTLSQDSVSTSNNYVDPNNFDTIPVRGNVSGVGGNQFAPPKYDEIPPYVVAASSNSGAATTSELSGSEQSGSSGRGSAEDDGEDEEIRMINEGPLRKDETDAAVRNTQEYLARLGIVNNPNRGKVPMDLFDEVEVGPENLIYAKLNDVNGSDRGGGSSNDDRLMSYGEVPVVAVPPAAAHQQPSMNGSLSSIVHSEEELAGSYNWDYLLDWGPQYQPLAHVFSEIARLKDDTASVHSGSSSVKTVPPPLITSIAPRSVLNARAAAAAANSGMMMMLPRSPISHDAAAGAAAMSPSFSPSLSPLATKSPSVSPLGHHVMARQSVLARNKSMVDAELRI